MQPPLQFVRDNPHADAAEVASRDVKAYIECMRLQREREHRAARSAEGEGEGARSDSILLFAYTFYEV
jgi:hypothetical protein